jgi:hypothetical protein
MKPKPTRLCIYPKDIQRITGRSERYCRKLLSGIRTDLRKQPHQPVTWLELAAYLSLPPEQVREMLLD